MANIYQTTFFINL